MIHMFGARTLNSFEMITVVAAQRTAEALGGLRSTLRRNCLSQARP